MSTAASTRIGKTLGTLQARLFSRLPVRPRTRLGRLAFRLTLLSIVTTVAQLLPGALGSFFFLISLLTLTVLAGLLLALAWRWVVAHFLWKVSNRLIVTYLLMGLAPIVLFATLAFIAAYTFAGQFAIYISQEEQIRGEAQLGGRTHRLTEYFAQLPSFPAALPEHTPENGEGGVPPTSVRVFRDGKPAHILGAEPAKKPGERGEAAREALAEINEPPAWAHDGFRGLVIDHNRLYLRAMETATVNGHTTTVLTSSPIIRSSMMQVAQGLGVITIVPDVSGDSHSDRGSADVDLEDEPVRKSAAASVSERSERAEELTTASITAGKLPKAQAFYDLPVSFYAPLPTTDWATGQSRDGMTHVTSRPSLLYQRLFSRSLKIAAFVQNALIAIALFFGLLELLAFLLAMRLNTTITRSISDLYRATLAIDRGDFQHRIEVTRNDQLAALSQSFNTMSGSLERLLEEQREKERLQGELAIAQEVQANLFPSLTVSLPMLEVHGVCHPARSVSGDYYDFLLSGTSDLSIALGDISGKGLSAALLMATLHSAVRAYRFAGEDMSSAGFSYDSVSSAIRDSDGEGGVAVAKVASATGISFTEPARILGLLNRHLYRSTQPEKYATLFLAHYDGVRRTLTYSTGGQLPPLLLRVDNSVARLDCGGTVVGLIDHMRYEQGEENMQPGDILIAYSDGVTEPENDFGDFGEDRLVEIVRRNRHLPLESISEQVMQALRSWIGAAEQPDDITLVLARQR